MISAPAKPHEAIFNFTHPREKKVNFLPLQFVTRVHLSDEGRGLVSELFSG